MKKMQLITLGFLALTLAIGAAGCGASASSDNLSYQYSENGCDTGSHSFSSKSDYCAALQNDALNNGCAGDLRQGDYKQNCS